MTRSGSTIVLVLIAPTLIEQELLPCPFCGCRAYSRHVAAKPPYGEVECGTCGAEMADLDEELAITAWNTRTLQGSAALPSDPNCTICDGNGTLVYSGPVQRACPCAMRATTPTAPVQDDDANESEKLKARIAMLEEEVVRRSILSRLSPTPETGLVEALERCRIIALEQRCQRETPWDLACTTIAAKLQEHIEAVLSKYKG